MRKQQKLAQQATFIKLRDEALAGKRPMEEVEQWMRFQSLLNSASSSDWGLIFMGAGLILLIAALVGKFLQLFGVL